MMVSLLLIIGMIIESIQVEGTLFVQADDNLTQIFVNTNDYTSKFDTEIKNTVQSAIVDISPGDDEVMNLLISTAVAVVMIFLVIVLRYVSLRVESRNMYYTAIYFNRFF